MDPRGLGVVVLLKMGSFMSIFQEIPRITIQHFMKLKGSFRTCLERKRGFSLEMIRRISSLMKIDSSFKLFFRIDEHHTSMTNKKGDDFIVCTIL